MNPRRDNRDTYPLFSVYASAVCAKGEEFLTTKSNPPSLGGCRVCESFDGRLLLLRAELPARDRNEKCQEMYKQPGQWVPYAVACAVGPNASLFT